MTNTNRARQPEGDGILLRPPVPADGSAVHALIRRCPPLDLNSSYAYFLLCTHYASTCVVAEQEGGVLGFLSAYRRPDAPDHLFVWQVAVEEAARGRGLAGRMLDALLARPQLADARYIETTVSPSNRSSRRVFERLAAWRDAAWHEEVFLSRAMFGADNHEEEVLFRIGPLARH